MAILALPAAASSGAEVMVDCYDCCSRNWLRKHRASAANAAAPPDELVEARPKAMKILQITLAIITLIAELYFFIIGAIKYGVPHDWVRLVGVGTPQMLLCIFALRSGYKALPRFCKAYNWEW